MICAYEKCDEEIPLSRRSNSIYHCHACYLLAKRDRDKKEYAIKAISYKKKKNNLRILTDFEKIQYPIPKESFDKTGYDWNCYDTQLIILPDEEIIYSIGQFIVTVSIGTSSANLVNISKTENTSAL